MWNREEVRPRVGTRLGGVPHMGGRGVDADRCVFSCASSPPFKFSFWDNVAEGLAEKERK